MNPTLRDDVAAAVIVHCDRLSVVLCGWILCSVDEARQISSESIGEAVDVVELIHAVFRECVHEFLCQMEQIADAVRFSVEKYVATLINDKINKNL